MDYGLIVKRDGINKDVEDCSIKELAFHSSYACAKILQTNRYALTIANGALATYTIALDSVVAFPTLILVFLYDPSDSSYLPINSENITLTNLRGSFWFDSSNLYVQVDNVTGGSVSTHFIYFICYA
jgi:hypothetical protein